MTQNRASTFISALAVVVASSLVMSATAYANTSLPSVEEAQEMLSSVTERDDAFRSIFADGFGTDIEGLLDNHVSLGETMVTQWAAKAEQNADEFVAANTAALANIIGDQTLALDTASPLFASTEEALAEVRASGFDLTAIDSVNDLYTQFAAKRSSIDGAIALASASVAAASVADFTPDFQFDVTPPEALSFGLLYDGAVTEMLANHGDVFAAASQGVGGQAFVDSFNSALWDAAERTSVSLGSLDSPCLAAFTFAVATGTGPADPDIADANCTPCVAAGTHMNSKLASVLNPATLDYGDGSLDTVLFDGAVYANEWNNLAESEGLFASAFEATFPLANNGTTLQEMLNTETAYTTQDAEDCTASSTGIGHALEDTLPPMAARLLTFPAEMPEPVESLADLGGFELLPDVFGTGN